MEWSCQKSQSKFPPLCLRGKRKRKRKRKRAGRSLKCRVAWGVSLTQMELFWHTCSSLFRRMWNAERQQVLQANKVSSCYHCKQHITRANSNDRRHSHAEDLLSNSFPRCEHSLHIWKERMQKLIHSLWFHLVYLLHVTHSQTLWNTFHINILKANVWIT